MIANWVRDEFGDAFIPLRIRLRNLRKLANNLTETLEDCPDLEQVRFVRGDADWLADKSTRFFIILDGFDELLLEGRATGGLKEFLQQVTDFQRRSHHQLLVTGRPLALQGIDRLITQNKDLERVRLEPMRDKVREQWLTKWQAIFGANTVRTFRQFLNACPTDITNTLAREPLLLYLLARLNREGRLSREMFADTQMGSNQKIQAKLRIYRESVNWVLEKQRQDENLRLSGLPDLDDLREVLQETALCVVQSGNEMACLEMVKQRFKTSSNPIAHFLREAQEATGQSEDRTLNNFLTSFYLKPGELDKQGSVEFAHKSFGEYLFAERLIIFFKAWTEVDERNRDRLSDEAVNEQIYDVFGYGGLSQEIVSLLFELLGESDINQVRLFNRLHNFYQYWRQSKFLDAHPTQNLPQKKLLQLPTQKLSIGLRQVDVFAGLNVMIILFKLHATAQFDSYPHLSKDTPRPAIWFHPCGEPNTEEFEADELLKVIHYADTLGTPTFAKIVGPHLARANLASANLASANLTSVYLASANLTSTILDSANLANAILDSANLVSANLVSTNLASANLASANLTSAILTSANLANANLARANLASAILDNAILTKAYLSRATLDSAILTRAYLTEANLTITTLTSTSLDSANLAKANLYSTNLTSADLTSANLTSANLDSANLTSTILIRANLDRANLDSTIFDSAILLETSLRNTKNLTTNQLEGNNPPLFCNAFLPPDLTINPNRDWGQIVEAFQQRHPHN